MLSASTSKRCKLKSTNFVIYFLFVMKVLKDLLKGMAKKREGLARASVCYLRGYQFGCYFKSNSPSPYSIYFASNGISCCCILRAYIKVFHKNLPRLCKAFNNHSRSRKSLKPSNVNVSLKSIQFIEKLSFIFSMHVFLLTPTTSIILSAKM